MKCQDESPDTTMNLFFNLLRGTRFQVMSISFGSAAPSQLGHIICESAVVGLQFWT